MSTDFWMGLLVGAFAGMGLSYSAVCLAMCLFSDGPGGHAELAKRKEG